MPWSGAAQRISVAGRSHDPCPPLLARLLPGYLAPGLKDTIVDS